MDNWFEELSHKRKKFDESVRENNFDEGIRHSTVEKYPDPVHFVYELLQNAEDQGATEAQFELFANRLVFGHNGSPFTRQDVENITGIGNSTKPQEANRIGRFGIGFKSIFAITERPEIYTVLEEKPFAFAIEHLVVPVPIPGNHGQDHQHNTQFIFPFIIGQETSLYAKIRGRLSSLGSNTMLFLQNLALIEWQTETDDGIYLRDVKGPRCELSGESRENGKHRQSSTSYLVFTRSANFSDKDRELDVRIAYKLDEEGRITPEPGQNLVVYFPTEQFTGLNFRLHGPFLLTDNRANIKNDNDENNKLIQECAILLGESIQRIKEEGLLSVEFLSLLPIHKDNIPPLFRPLYEQVLQTLKRYPLLPTADGMFAKATEVKLARSAELRDLINNQQLSSLYGTSTSLHWLSSEITIDKMPDLHQYLNKELKIEFMDPESFVRRLKTSFLEKQSDEWLLKLYTFLSKQQGLTINNIIKRTPILRLEDNSHVSPFKRTSPFDRNETPNAYLLRIGKSEFPLVKRSLIADNIAYEFLKRIGLSEPNVVDEVLTFILPAYEAGEVALDDEVRNKQDLGHIQEALQRTDHRARQHLLSKLNETPFIQANNARTAERAWKTPYEVYSRAKELFIWFEGNEETWFITDSFPESLLTDLNIPTHLLPKAKSDAGTTSYVIINKSKGYHQRGLHHFDPHATLDGLQHAIDHITTGKAKILWGVLLDYRHLIKGVVETSKSYTFADAQTEDCFSEIGRLCCQKAWLPTKDGDFCSPGELFLTDLPEGFEKSTDEARELALKLEMRKAEELQLADKLGIPHDAISIIQQDHDAFVKWYKEQQRRKVLLPSSIANDPNRRMEKATEAAYHAEEKTYKAVTINRRISAEKKDTKAYLRSHNTDEEDQLICQLCDDLMPFRLPNGEEYFEAYQYTEVLEKEYEANHLALCPNCAAEFQHACQTDQDARAKLILDLDPAVDEAKLIVHIDMPVHRQLRFTQRHLIDLQVAIQDWRKADPERVK